MQSSTMSAATTAAPSVVRSTSRRQQSYNPPASAASERHQRTPSSTTRTPTNPVEPHRQESQSQSNGRGNSASQLSSLAGVARRDYETTNLARPPSSRRSSSRDRSTAAPPSYSRTESNRGTHRSTSKSGHVRYSSDMTGAVAASNGGPTPVAASSSGRSQGDGAGRGGPPPVKRRTTIETQTGEWSLGKTIGAGSMGKVKLAKNMETSEQVGLVHSMLGKLIKPLIDYCSLRLLSRLCQDNPQMNLTVPETANEQTIPRR